MNAPVLPEHLVRRGRDEPVAPSIGPEARRIVWEGRFATIVIEVIGDEIRVNGDHVVPARSLER